MTNEEIKVEVDKSYKIIQQEQDKLKVLRSECTHTKTEKTNWSYRVGVCEEATVCSDCGKFLNFG